MIAQLVLPLQNRLFVANGPCVFLVEMSDSDPTVACLPSVENESAPSYMYLGACYDQSIVVAVDVVFGYLLEIRFTSRGPVARKIPWSGVRGNPRSIAYAFGRWWCVTSGEHFDERFLSAPAPDGVVPQQMDFQEFNAPLAMYGYSAVQPHGDWLAVFDSVLGVLVWIDSTLAVVNSLQLAERSIIGVAHDGTLIACEPQGNAVRIDQFASPFERRTLLMIENPDWDRIFGITQLMNGSVVVVDSDLQFHVFEQSSTSPRRIVVNWARARADALIDRSASAGQATGK